MEKSMSTTEAKAFVDSLRGEKLTISVNKGRKRIINYSGSVAQVYPSVFTLNIENEQSINVLSCSYADFICGGVKLIKA